MFREVWQPGYRTQFSSVQSCARWTHSHHYFLIDCQRHRRNIGCLECSRNQRNGLMAQPRGRNQKCRLHFVTLYTFNQPRNHLFSQPRRVGNETAATPKDWIKLSDNPVGFKLEQTTERYQRIAIAFDSGWVIASRRKPQILRFNLGRDLTKADVSIRRAGVKWRRTVDISTGGRNKRQVQHWQSTAGRRKGSAVILYERIRLRNGVAAAFVVD